MQGHVTRPVATAAHTERRQSGDKFGATEWRCHEKETEKESGKHMRPFRKRRPQQPHRQPRRTSTRTPECPGGETHLPVPQLDHLGPREFRRPGVGHAPAMRVARASGGGWGLKPSGLVPRGRRSLQPRSASRSSLKVLIRSAGFSWVGKLVGSSFALGCRTAWTGLPEAEEVFQKVLTFPRAGRNAERPTWPVG